MKNADLPAMPQERGLWVEGVGLCPTEATGLTKREMFAMHVMASWIDHPLSRGDYGFNKREAARSAVECADALLEELEK